jgi:hypothetical protein
MELLMIDFIIKGSFDSQARKWGRKVIDDDCRYPFSVLEPRSFMNHKGPKPSGNGKGRMDFYTDEEGNGAIAILEFLSSLKMLAGGGESEMTYRSGNGQGEYTLAKSYSDVNGRKKQVVS